MTDSRELDSAVGEFLAESEEILARVSNNLTLLERGGCSGEQLDELYRDMHTLKGSAQLFGFNDIGTVAHAMEACLDPIRKRHVSPSPALLDSIFKCVDLVEALVRNVGSGSTSAELVDRMLSAVPRLTESACAQFGAEIRVFKDVIVPTETFGRERARRDEARTVAAPSPSSLEGSVAAAAASAPSPDAEGGRATAGAVDSVGVDTTVRVQVGLLDKLMNLVGEMVLVRNQVLQYSNRTDDSEFVKLSQRLDLVTSELQDQVMRTRMQPIGNVVSKFQRLIRDLAKDLGKQIDLTIQGKDTELDKTLLEAIKDPLTHIVRNSCDHGIETPADRLAASKPSTGHVLISAFHEGGQVIIEISDDGKGLNRKRIVKKAVERGLVSAEKAEGLSDRDVLNIIFLPGFSTAEQVSSVSGRGVGMDVVRTNIEKIGGSVDLESVEGKGTTIRLRIPLTLAIVPAMLVRSGRATYAIPQVKLVELVRVEVGETVTASGKIQLLQGKPVYELRGRILPLVDLSRVLGRGVAGDWAIEPNSTLNIVVLHGEDGYFGLVVDEVMDTADIVVKPLSKFLKALELYSAATILGTGSVALIIDPIGIAKAAQLAVSGRKQEGAFADQEQVKKNSDAQEYLLFKTAAPGTYAIPLCMVSRLEEFSRSRVEHSGRQAIVQYRNVILPLIDVNEVLGFKPLAEVEPDQLPTIVVQRSGKAVGLSVDAILDVMMVDMSIDESVKDRFGILGNLIAGREVITVLDVLSIVEREMERLSPSTGGAPTVRPDIPATTVAERPKILYAEDVAFFRRQVTKLLASKGYDVVTANDGKAALDILSAEDAPQFALILSDIEMPHMNGYRLAENARKIARFSGVPIVALTTRFTQKDIEDGMKAGFNSYLEKLNPDVLVAKLEELMVTKETAA